ncbi:ABC transporter substrate-binding protein [Gammaproteobacteria bacterium]|nr:ABC transporter substrate-binding protein [Gammaproteobacteria bacterium]
MSDRRTTNHQQALIMNAKNGGIRRREFMQGMIALGATTAGASALWSERVEAQTPKRGGTFRFATGSGSTSDNLDPGAWDAVFNQTMGSSIHNFLAEIDANGVPQPELAESIESSSDSKEWIFQLRKGVTFHNGRDITAADVVASINFHRGDDSTSAAKPLLTGINDIQADGIHTVRVTLNDGNADLPFIMADYHLPIMPAGSDGRADWRSGIGCGPYKLDNLDAGVRLELSRNADYWKSNRAHFDDIVMLSIPDPASRTNALVSGEVDAIDKVDLKTVSLLKRRPNIVVRSVSGTQHYTFAMHTNVAPFDNKDVRLALKYAVKRDEMIEKILQGYGQVGNDHPIGSGQQYFASELEQTSYNPDLAREHLKKAGLDSLDVSLHVADAAFNGAVDAGALYAESAKAAGINIQVVREPNDGYWSDVWLKKPFSAVYWSGRPTCDEAFSIAYASGVPWNDTNFEHERFNDLLVTARSESDMAKRSTIYAEMQTILNREGGTIIPMFASYVTATTDKIGTGEVASNYDIDGLRAFERWWFTS